MDEHHKERRNDVTTIIAVAINNYPKNNLFQKMTIKL